MRPLTRESLPRHSSFINKAAQCYHNWSTASTSIADLSPPEAHLQSNSCISLQQVVLPCLVPSEGGLHRCCCSMLLAQLGIGGAGLPAFHPGLDGHSSSALFQEGSAVLQHTPCALNQQHRPASTAVYASCADAALQGQCWVNIVNEHGAWDLLTVHPATCTSLRQPDT